MGDHDTAHQAVPDLAWVDKLNAFREQYPEISVPPVGFMEFATDALIELDKLKKKEQCRNREDCIFSLYDRRRGKDATDLKPNRRASNKKRIDSRHIKQAKWNGLLNSWPPLSASEQQKIEAIVRTVMNGTHPFRANRNFLNQHPQWGGETERNFVHPMMFSVFDEMQDAGLFGDSVHWIEEPLTTSAKNVQDALMSGAEAEVVWRAHQPSRKSGDAGSLPNETACESSSSSQATDSSDSLGDKRSRSWVDDAEHPRKSRKRSGSRNRSNSGRGDRRTVPDGLFSLHPARKGDDTASFRACEQATARIALELKTNIYQDFYTAVSQCTRSNGATRPLCALQASIVGDGQFFFFVRQEDDLWWCSPPFNLALQDFVVHPRQEQETSLDIVTDEDPSPASGDSSTESDNSSGDQDAPGLFEFLCALVRCVKHVALLPSPGPPAYSEKMKVPPFELQKTLCLNKNSFVGLYVHETEEDQRVLKLDSRLPGARVSNHTELEIYSVLREAGLGEAILPAFIEDPQLEGLPSPIISLKWEGDSLASMCFCEWTEDQVEVLRHAVQSQVEDILAAYHEKGFAFVDIHEGNVIVRRAEKGGWTVRLIDIESVRPLDKSWDDTEGCHACQELSCCWRHTKPASVIHGKIKDCTPTTNSDFATLAGMMNNVFKV